MFLLYSTSKYLDFYAEIHEEKAQVDVITRAIEEDKGQTSSSSSFAIAISNYEKLPDHLKSCFDYCYIVLNNYGFRVGKQKLVYFLMAQCLIPEKPGEIIEDTAANIINELIDLGMLEVDHGPSSKLEVSKLYRKSCVLEVEEKDFIDKAVNSPIHLILRNKGKHLPSNYKSHIRSLFIKSGVSNINTLFETVCGLQFLSVLIIHTEMDYLPDEIGNLVHLQFLGLQFLHINKLPCAIGNLLKLQTLDISWSPSLRELPIEIMNNKQLRHLIFLPYLLDGITIPKGFATLVNLQTLTGVSAGNGFASELSSLTQLRRLDLGCVSEDNGGEIAAAIMKMDNLISLSLHAEKIDIHPSPRNTKEDITVTIELLPELESFSLPPHLQELCLNGRLIEIPNWFLSMENLIKLDLYNSNLSENPSSILQFLPKLKYLTLRYAYKAKVIGKEFCNAGGFPELELLEICSQNLIEWTEIVNGAFPKLRHLEFLGCINLRFLPEGLQNISTIQKLYLGFLHEDLARRLTSQENYKIKHIANVWPLSLGDSNRERFML